MTYDDLDNHLPAAGSIDRAAVPLGMYLAWCANLGLLSTAFQQAHERLVLRLRYREITGSELLVAGCGGSLTSDVLSEAGCAFTRTYLSGFLADCRAVFGEDVYGVQDDWSQYDRIAPVLTKKYMTGRADPVDSGKRWWQIWR